MYALAAGAAGVGLLALAPAAEAKIIYTPAHRVITPKHSFNIDFNHDGITDFKIANSVSEFQIKGSTHYGCLIS